MRLREAVDEVDLNRYIPNKVAKDILGVIGSPLSKGDDVPEPRDLRSFWRVAERAITGLNSNVDLDMLTGRGCKNLGPILLGEAAFVSIKNEHFDDWAEFK